MSGERTVRVRFDGDSSGLARAARQSEQEVSRWQRGIERAGRLASGAAVASAAVLGAAMAPVLAAALAGGVLLALGGGVLVAGIIAASKDPAVSKAFGGLGDRAKKAFAGFVEPFKGPLIRAADTFGDALERMAPTINALGAKMAPLIDKLAPALASMAERALPGLAAAAEKSVPAFETIAGLLPKVGNWISVLVIKLAALAEWGVRNREAIAGFLEVALPIVGIVVAVVAAIKVWIAVQAALNVVMALNPVGLIVIAIVALIAIIVLIATKTTWFQTAWRVAWSAIQAALSAWWSYAQWVFGLFVAAVVWLKDRVVAGIKGAIAVFQLWQRGVGAAKDWIVGKLQALLSWITSLPGRIKSGLLSVASILSAPFKAAFNAISRFWNNTAGRLSFTAPSWVPGFGGKGFSLPKLPQLQHGGPAVAGRSYLVGERGPEVLTMGAQSGTVTPNHALGVTPEVHVYIGDQELRGIVRVEVSESNRGLKRRVTAGAGAAR